VLRNLRSRSVLRVVATLVTLALTLEVALITLPLLLLLLGVAAKCVARSKRRVVPCVLVAVVTGGVSLFNLFPPADLDRAWRPGEGGGPRATMVAGNVASVVAAVTLLLVLALLLLGRYVGK
jgi:hypothetical protein